MKVIVALFSVALGALLSAVLFSVVSQSTPGAAIWWAVLSFLCGCAVFLFVNVPLQLVIRSHLTVRQMMFAQSAVSMLCIMGFLFVTGYPPGSTEFGGAIKYYALYGSLSSTSLLGLVTEVSSFGATAGVSSLFFFWTCAKLKLRL
jgi:hypothetical protein